MIVDALTVYTQRSFSTVGFVTEVFWSLSTQCE